MRLLKFAPGLTTNITTIFYSSIFFILFFNGRVCQSAQMVDNDHQNPAAEAELVTPHYVDSEQRLNLINAQRTTETVNFRPTLAKRRRQRIHSVSRSVNSQRSQQLLEDAQVLSHPVDHLDMPKAKEGEESAERVTGRTVLTNDGLERIRAVVLVPPSIEHPRVLTAETFVGGRLQFRESGKRRRRIGKRVEGETVGKLEQNGKGTLTELSDTVPEKSAAKKLEKPEKLRKEPPVPINTTSLELDVGRSNSTPDSNSPVGFRFPAEDWQLPPEVLMARLRGFQQQQRQKVNAATKQGRALTEYMRKIGLIHDASEHGDPEKPQVSFLIDEARISKQKEEIVDQKFPSALPVPVTAKTPTASLSLRTKFPKNRQTLKPIQLTKADESDMDLLSPPGTAPAGGPIHKPVQQFAAKQHPKIIQQPPHFQLASVNSNGNVPRPPQFPPRQIQPPAAPFAVNPKNSYVHQKPPQNHQHQQQPFSPPNIVPAASAVPQRPLPKPIVPVVVQHNNQSNYKLPPINSLSILGGGNSSQFAQLGPNGKLELCCRRQQLPKSCQQFCNFDTFTQEKLLVALLGSQCPASQLGKAFDCAHSKVDHSECCERAGIHLINGGQCMVFCRTHIPTPPNVLGYVSCLSQFGTIKNCYRDHQLRHRNLFGD